MGQFFEMGGYGTFIWGSYGISAVVLVLLVIASIRQLRRVEAALEPLETARRAIRKKSSDRKVPS